MDGTGSTHLDGQQTVRAFSSAARLLADRLGQELRHRTGMRQIHYEILAWLSETPDRQMAMSHLAHRMGVSYSRLSHLVSRMEAFGWLERTRSPMNQRIHLAKMTGAGMLALQSAVACQVECVRSHVLGRLTPVQLNQLREISEALMGHLTDRFTAAADVQGEATGTA
ncbi:MarR family winged helix-turn-helix transcriptional regulator [Streptomyces sp. NPDC046805]|uniref:MarR family winged helix-turn-helix transcriptional regulator n=1 Tax=Streptomyces sp. NPDC046805 TaxID=3155134 RepID=UPI0033C8985D